MKQKKRTRILAACVLSAVISCAALSMQVMAEEAVPTAETEGQAINETEVNQDYNEYNLASEDWDELLGVSSEESSETTSNSEETTSSATEDTTSATESEGVYSWLSSIQKSDGGISKLMIIGIIAFALGAIGVAFFIYSQFIYKAKLRRKQEEMGTFSVEDEYDPYENTGELYLNFGDDQPAEEQPSGTKEAPLEETTDTLPIPVERHRAPDKTLEIPNTSLTKEDEEKLQNIDWDDFFNQSGRK